MPWYTILRHKYNTFFIERSKICKKNQILGNNQRPTIKKKETKKEKQK